MISVSVRNKCINFIAVHIYVLRRSVNEVRAICEETGNGLIRPKSRESQQGGDNLDEIIRLLTVSWSPDNGYWSTIRNGSSLQMIITKANAAGKVAIWPNKQ